MSAEMRIEMEATQRLNAKAYTEGGMASKGRSAKTEKSEFDHFLENGILKANGLANPKEMQNKIENEDHHNEAEESVGKNSNSNANKDKENNISGLNGLHGLLKKSLETEETKENSGLSETNPIDNTQIGLISNAETNEAIVTDKLKGSILDGINLTELLAVMNASGNQKAIDFSAKIMNSKTSEEDGVAAVKNSGEGSEKNNAVKALLSDAIGNLNEAKAVKSEDIKKVNFKEANLDGLTKTKEAKVDGLTDTKGALINKSVKDNSSGQKVDLTGIKLENGSEKFKIKPIDKLKKEGLSNEVEPIGQGIKGFEFGKQTLEVQQTNNSLKDLDGTTKLEPYSQISKEIIAKLDQKGPMEFSMQLKPADLGLIDIKMKINNGKLVIDIMAANEKTQGQLTNQVDKLISNLGLSNVKVENIQVVQNIGTSNQQQIQQEQYAMNSGMNNFQRRNHENGNSQRQQNGSANRNDEISEISRTSQTKVKNVANKIATIGMNYAI